MKPVSVNALKEKMKLTKMDAFKKMTNSTRKKQHKKNNIQLFGVMNTIKKQAEVGSSIKKALMMTTSK